MPSGPPPGKRPPTQAEKKAVQAAAKRKYADHLAAERKEAQAMRRNRVTKYQKDKAAREQQTLKAKGRGQLAQFLRQKGYRVWKGADKRLMKAVELYAKGGKGNIGVFDKAFPKAAPKSKTPGYNPNAPSPEGADAAADQYGGGYETDFGDPFSESLAGRYTPLGEDYAEGMAAAQYDQLIRAAEIDRMRQERQGKQSMRDVGNWYEQVTDAQGVAAGRDAEINQAASGSIQQAVQAIMSSLGGGANPGAGVVGAAGADAVGTLGALQSTQEQYNADMGPLLQSEAAGAKMGQSARNTAASQAIQQRLQDLGAQRGQAKSGAMFDIQLYNDQQSSDRQERLFRIQQANNQLAQQGFQNERALTAEDLAAQAYGLKLADTASRINARGTPKAPPKVDPIDIANSVGQLLGVGADLRLPQNVSVQQLAQTIGTTLAGYGITRGSPLYKQLGQTIIQGFFDGSGRPLQVNPGWFG